MAPTPGAGHFAKAGKNFKRTGFSHDEYGTLLFDYVYFIKTLRPAAFLLENVPGLLTVDGGEQLTDAIADLRGAGYRVTSPSVLDAAHFGVPQRRSRVFIVGHRMRGRSAIVLPPPSVKWATVCGGVLERPIGSAPNHITRKHKAASILRYMDLSFGEREPLGRVDRLDPLLPSKTVIAGGSGGGGRSHLHPMIPRTLSVRECARLQTFPDSHEFIGSPARQFTQVGNAVPPLLAAQLAVAMKEQLFS